MIDSNVCIDVTHLNLTFVMRECQKCKHPLYAETDDAEWTCPKCDPEQFLIENPGTDLAAIPSYPLNNKSK